MTDRNLQPEAQRPTEVVGAGDAHAAESADQCDHSLAIRLSDQTLMATAPDGAELTGSPIAAAVRCLLAGGVVALKGPGGFQLLADASYRGAVEELRRRKRRDAGPLAVMVRSLASARRLVELSAAEAALLESAERPIVLARRAIRAADQVDAALAPEQPWLGVMLPATPLHEMLLADFTAQTRHEYLVVTSGNPAGEPPAVAVEEARRRLAGVADLFLDHDGQVRRGADDSVLRVDPGGPTFIRRARGHAELPIQLAREVPAILAAGAGRPNAICVTHARSALVSSPQEDLTAPGAAEHWSATARDLLATLDGPPQAIAVDLDAADPASRLGRDLGPPVVEVQHHHAHIAACLSEHGHTETAIGLVLDGAAIGTDGELWGGEVLLADVAGFTRAGHLERVPLVDAGGAGAEPWQLAVSHLFAAYGDVFRRLPLSLFERIEWLEIEEVVRRARQAGDLPFTSSAVQLFDAVAAILGLCYQHRFTGDATIALESVMGELGGPGDETYGVRIEPRADELVLRTEPLIRGVVVDLIRGLPPEVISLRFHRSLAALLAAACECVWKRAGIYTVVLGGELVHNVYLTSELTRRLKRLGFAVLRPRLLPPGDGGLAFGQAMVAAARLAGG